MIEKGVCFLPTFLLRGHPFIFGGEQSDCGFRYMNEQLIQNDVIIM